jgi:ribonuclease HII
MEVKNNREFIFGIDEAGRGPLAGPVVVGIFAMQKGLKIRGFPKNKDSKKMTEEEREYWFEVFQDLQKEEEVFYKVCFGSNLDIDQKGIMHCIRKVMQQAIKHLNKKTSIDFNSKILLDGALYAPKEYLNQQTIIKGDEKETVIACASIVAKVSRDRLMKKLSRKYPVYAFEKHKGYGTKEHRLNISKYGICNLHRQSYLSFINKTSASR